MIAPPTYSPAERQCSLRGEPEHLFQRALVLPAENSHSPSHELIQHGERGWCSWSDQLKAEPLCSVSSGRVVGDFRFLIVDYGYRGEGSEVIVANWHTILPELR